MPLIDLKTNLKDLRFGHDEYKGASSNEPYVQTRIPATDEPLQTGFSVDASLNVDPNVSILANNVGSGLGNIAASAGVGAIGGSVFGPIGTLIGAGVGLGVGILGAVNASPNGLELGIKADPKIKASLRINIPRAGTGGPDFLLRGGLLLPDRIGDDIARLSKFFTDTKGLLFTIKQNLLSRTGTRAQGTVGILNERLYTPLSTVLGAAGNAFGLHPNKQGLNPLLGIGNEYVPNRYFEAIVNEINEVGTAPDDLQRRNRLTGLYSNILVFNKATRNFNRTGISLNDGNNILSYQGGPGSFLGVGRTNIRFATDNVGAPLTIGNAVNANTFNYEQLSQASDEILDGVDYVSSNPKIIDFRAYNISYTSPLYSGDKTLEIRTNLGDPGNPFSKNTSDYTSGYAYGAASPNSYDKINALPIYQYNSNNGKRDPQTGAYPDLINFRIGVIDNDNSDNIEYIHFRAFLNKISDNYNAKWDSTKYIGRGENFYTYSGFDRKFSLSWTVAAQSNIELKVMYKKLNYLASICAPDYSNNGYMRGNIVKLTIGDYINEQYGIINGFSFDMNEDNDTWEIGIDDVGNNEQEIAVPHIIRVNSFEFIPIHDFVPNKQDLTFDEFGNIADNGYGSENYILNNYNYNNDKEIEKILNNFNGLPLSVEETDVTFTEEPNPSNNFTQSTISSALPPKEAKKLVREAKRNARREERFLKKQYRKQDRLIAKLARQSPDDIQQFLPPNFIP